MAEKNLKSLKFHGLDDIYKIPSTAEDVGATPVSHLNNSDNPHNVTASQIGAAVPSDVTNAKTMAINESKTYTDSQVRKATPRNLLDNSDFRNPVNQRGATTKNGPIWTHVIDRWYISLNEGETSELTSEGLGANADFSIQQRFPKGYLNPDEEYTSVVYFSDGSFVLAERPSFTNAGFDSLSYTTINIGSKKISAVGLYKGKYTVDTLPEYQSKGYGVELAECLRYYQKLLGKNAKTAYAAYPFEVTDSGAYAVVTIPFMTQMRVNPSINNKIQMTVMHKNQAGATLKGSSGDVSVHEVSTEYITIKVATTMTTTGVYMYVSSPTDDFAVSADL